MKAAENTDGKATRTSALKEATDKLAVRLDGWRQKNEAEQGKESKMNGFNRVVLMGRLTRDPQARQLASGITVADLSLAISEVYKKKDGESAEKTCFVDIVAWGRQAETCAQYLKKGSPVLVEGRLQFDRWESPEGQKRSKHKIKADRVQFLNGGAKKGSEPQADGAELVGATTDEGNDPF